MPDLAALSDLLALDFLGPDPLGRALAVAVPLLYGLGVLSALDAVMTARTPQGSAAWALALVAFPLVALPLYWMFGRSQFTEYVEVLRGVNRRVDAELGGARGEAFRPFLADEADDDRGERRAFGALASFPFTRGNGARLLVDGAETFPALDEAIRRAERYVLVQFYILRADATGRRLHDALCERARAGVRVCVLYDDVGSFMLPRRYRRTLREAGVEVSGFPGRRGWLGRFRINFRNHRKIVVVDGRVGFTGGLNVGDEYRGRDPKLSPWRDTHLRVEGPVVLGLQLSFVKDWFFSTGRFLADDLAWAPAACVEDRAALVVATGPADEAETCSLLFAHAIAAAERRVWIATPYFVPDSAVFAALQVAALRGVDVRVLVPRVSDNLLFRFVPYAYLPDVDRAGVKVCFFEPGFMHQKVLLVDDDYAAVSSANLDNRSFRLNFEVTALFADRPFCADVERMLDADFAHGREATAEDLATRKWPFRFAVRVTRLFAPVL